MEFDPTSQNCQCKTNGSQVKDINSSTKFTTKKLLKDFQHDLKHLLINQSKKYENKRTGYQYEQISEHKQFKSTLSSLNIEVNIQR